MTKQVLRLMWMLVAAIYLDACTTLQPLPSTGGPPWAALHAGDQVRITTRDGQARMFKVTSASPQSVCGAPECIDTKDAVLVEREQVDGARTTLLVMSIVLLVALMALAAAGPPINALP